MLHHSVMRRAGFFCALVVTIGCACGGVADDGSSQDALESSATAPELPIPTLMNPSKAKRGDATTYDVYAVQGGKHYFDSQRWGETYAYSDGSTVGMPSADIADAEGKIAVYGKDNGKTLGPTLRVRRGEKLDVTLHGELRDAITSLHWHGLAVPAEADTFPLVQGVGKSGVPISMDPAMMNSMSHEEMASMHQGTAEANAKFTIDQEASTLWYHPHIHMDVARALYQGLAGLLLVDDDHSDALAKAGLPSDYGVDDIPLIVQDYRFAKKGKDGSTGEMTYQEISDGDEKDGDGFLGDHIAVNGTLRPVLAAKRTLTRFRIVNASTARAYQLGFDNRMEFKIIATDGGFLNEPVVTHAVALAPAERIEIVVDLAETDATKGVSLVSYPYNPIDPRSALATRDSKNPKAWKLGSDADAEEDIAFGRPPAGFGFTMLRITTSTKTEDSQKLGKNVPSKLRPTALPPASALHATSAFKRVLRLEGPGTDDKKANPKGIDFASTINNRKFNMAKVLAGDLESEVRVDAKWGDTEVWQIKNEADDMAHPFHFHGRPFRVLSRSSGPLSPTDYGLKDTVQVFPGETVNVLLEYTVERTYNNKPSLGVFYYHCHILEHEDMGMMGLFRVGDAAKPGKDNVTYDTRTACDHAHEKCE